MVLPLLIAGGLVIIVIMFKDQIKGFADDLRRDSNDPENIAKQKKIDERGALENTQAFFLGEQGLQDLKDRTAQNEAKVNQFLLDSQANLNTISAGAKLKIDESIGAVNTSLVQSQQQLEKFANEAQVNIAKSIDETGKNIDTQIKATQTAIDTSIKETQTSIDTTFKGAQDFFGNLFNNPFGGQKPTKQVVKQIPLQNFPQRPQTEVTVSPKGTGIDLSFLTPNTSFTPVARKEVLTLEQVASNDRGSRTRFGE